MRNNKKNVILRLFVLIVFMLIQVVGFSISIQARIDEQQTVTMKNKKELTQENIVQNPEKQMKKIINEQLNPDRKIKKKINRSGDVGELNNNATPEFSFVEGVSGYKWYTQVDIAGWDTINLNNIGEDVYEQTTVLYPPLFDVKFDLGGYGDPRRVNLYYQPDELEDNQYEFYYTNSGGHPTIISSSDITDENEKWLGYQSSGILVKPGTDITITSLMDRANVAEEYNKMNLDIYLRYFDKSGDLIISEKFPVEREDINTDTGFELMHTVPEDAVSLDILYNPYVNADDIDGSHNGAYDGYLFGVKEASVYGEYPDNELEGDIEIFYYSEDGEDLLEGGRYITGNIGEVVSPTIYDMDGYNYVGIDGVTPIRITDEDQEIKIIYEKDSLFNNIELIKYGEIDNGKDEELEDVEFILQFQITTSDWYPSNLEKGDWYEIKNISLDPTDEDGKIVLDKEDIRFIYKELEELGFDEEDVTFRFREIQSPQGYQNPPSYSPKEYEGYKYESSDLDSELKDFVVDFQITVGDEDEDKNLSLELVNKINTSHEESLEIETSDMSVPLGTEIDTDQVKKHITSVELLENGKTTKLDDYSIDDIVTSDSVPTNVVGSGETVVNITGIKNGKEIKGVASIPTEVTWGNDISLGGFTSPADESTLALSLINEGNNAKIVGTYGDNTKHDRPIHSGYSDVDYYQIDYFPRGTSSTLNLTNDLTEKGTKSLTLKGKQTPADAVEGWGTQEVEAGDIIRVWMKEETKLNWYQNGEKQDQLSKFPNRNLIYFEVTKDGFKPLYNNQVKGKTNISINQGTSTETLNAKYHNNPKALLDIPESENYESIQYSMDKFEQYPDTKTVGKNKTSKVSMTGQTKNTFGKLNITFDVNPTFDVVEQQEYEGIIKNPEFKKEVNSSGRVTSVPNWNFSATGYNLRGETSQLIFTDTLTDKNYTKMTRSDGENLSGLGEIGIANTDDGTLNASVKGNVNQNGGIVLFVYQTIDTTPGQSYEFSVDLSSEGTDKRGFSIYDGKDISGPIGWLGGVYKESPGVSGSETLKTIFTAKSETTTISFRFYAASNTSHIDSIKNPTIQEINWLPSYEDKWKNSNTDTIPKENAFVMMESDDTRIVGWSDGVAMGGAATDKNVTKVSFSTDGPQWVMWDNVGYYDGENISVKMTVDTAKDSSSSGENAKKYNTIGIRGIAFLEVSFLKESESANVTYEFFNSEREPIKINGYWTMQNIDDGKSIEILNNQISKIYSTPHAGDNPNLISYDQTEKYIKFTGHGHFAGDDATKVPTDPPNLEPEQLEMTMTFNKQESFSYKITIEPQNPFFNNYLSYTSSSIAKVEIPDPQPVNQTVEKITKDNRDKLTNEFVQQIPYESSRNRNQKMTWTVSNIKNDDVFSSGDWKVYDETGKEQTKLFEFTEDNKTIKPENLSNENLYNHYYRFVYSLPFNDKGKVDESQLITKDGGKYLPYSQDISLEVDSLSPVVATTTTDINFKATINYSYTDEEGNPITTDGLAETETSLITKPYPVTKGPEIEGYTFSKSDPSDLTNKKILYTNNTVTFIYDKINKVWMTVNYYQLDRNGEETNIPVLENLKEDKEAKSLRKEVEVGNVISEEVAKKTFNSYLYEKSIVTNDETPETIKDDIVPTNDFTVNRYYQPLENLSVPKTISFGEKNAQRLKDEYSVKNSPSPINFTSGYSNVKWSLSASSKGLFSEEGTRLLSDMYFRLNGQKMIINEQDTVLASQVNKHYYDLPLVTEDNKEGLFLEIGNSGTKDSKYSGKIKFSMVTGP